MGRIYDTAGLSPTINCCGGDKEPKVLLEYACLTPKRTDYGKAIRKQYEKGQLNISRHDMTKVEPREDGCTNTLTTVQKDNLIAEPIRIPQATAQGYVEIEPGSVFDWSYPNSKTRRGRLQDNGQSSPTLTANGEPPSYYEEIKDMNYRIRKLTPRECFRLMDVAEIDIDKLLNSGISNSQLYKLAGNSIVVSCLYHIFRKMFIETQNENQQLTLF